MIPHLTWWQRLIGWLLWKMEARTGFAGGFSDPMEGAEWVFGYGYEYNYNYEKHLYCVSLLRNYYYVRKYEEWERTHVTPKGE